MRIKKPILVTVVSLITVFVLVMTLYFSSPYLINMFGSYEDPFDNFTGLFKDVDISPDDQRMVFSYYIDGVASIYTAKVDGTDVKRLTYSQKESHLSPKFSSDGSKILFLSYPKNVKKPYSYLYIMNLDGTNVTQITTDKKEITEAIFSPDNQKIYAISPKKHDLFLGRSGDFDIYSLKIDGSDTRQLTNLKSFDMSDLSITSDGKKLLFGTYESFYFLSLKDSEELTSFQPKGSFATESFGDLGLSPDNKSIVFSAAVDMPVSPYQYELFSMDSETHESIQLTKVGSFVGEPRFYHKKDKILFVLDLNWANNPPKYQLMLMNKDGSNVSKVEIPISHPK
jgi:Tol biopolymer transport system component